MVGFISNLAPLLNYLRRRSPGPPFPPDHRQAGERGAIIDHVVEAPSEKGNLNGETTNTALVTKINSHWIEESQPLFHISYNNPMGFAPHVRSRYRQVHARHRSVKMCACVQFVHRSPVVVQNLVTWTARLLPVYRSNASWAKVGVHQVLPGRLIEHAREHDLFIVAVARSRSNLLYRLHVGTLDRTAIAPPESKRPCGD